ncbi:class I SAM-dependent DNA methyltransferase [Paracoccus methylovorus]|uniref:site-specific DNA-methyltransferase (adenine-specific) n=1 Tax=Paracoccus methylovorus TaxID=2812658 RepID=A0ABX7JSG6_9RHOB|nr:class I SAM-dependent DNA methyltransferase [Paracoccus methylovorus]QRZ15582.1 class I SAM-dependent DNA methyltransferase [Paracoccus methylovorus]
MNAVEIEEAITALADQPYDAAEFPFAFLLAFGNKDTTIKRLRAGSSNKSDLGGVLQANNIHIKTCAEGQANATLAALRDSPATARAKAKFILATDGTEFQAEDLTSGEAIICAYADFPNHFGFFLPLAGITTVRAIRESAFDIRATSRLNRLYVELLKDNPDWGTAARRHDMNQFMARLIFCFFAEDTGIFSGDATFTRTIDTMSARDSSNTHEVIGALFHAMNTRPEDRTAEGIPRWADPFPYVNGELFSGTTEAPRFSKIARSYLLTIGGLDWTQVNPDIFGSMIQAVADEDERGALGMHYTSVPNILKVLNPLFLDDLRAALEEARDNGRKLLNLRNRMARIRVFDPACGSGNFLVIAYKELRAIEAQINARRGEADRRSEITLTNFRGIELKDFPATIARLALIIAEYQCDVLHRGQREATRDFLPLDSKNWITCGNALRLDWLSICPPTGTGVKLRGDDLFSTPLDQAEVDFENEGGETYICGNPPYLGSKWQSLEQKGDLKNIFDGRCKNWKSLDYVAGWFMKAADFGSHTPAAAAFVSTNSICQGQQVPILWPTIFGTGHHILFAHTSFKWANLASHNAGVTVVIVGITSGPSPIRSLFLLSDDGETIRRETANINAYLVAAPNVEVQGKSRPMSGQAVMQFGNHPYYGAPLIFSVEEGRRIVAGFPQAADFIRPLYGSQEFINAAPRACLWIADENAEAAAAIPPIAERLKATAASRRAAIRDKAAQKLAETPYRFRDQTTAEGHVLVVPRVSSENRPFLPIGLLNAAAIIQDQAFALYDAPLWNMALIASRLHLVWIATVCGKLETRYRYSNTLGWNTFPVPPLTEKQKSDLVACAVSILLAREAHFPATIADLYDPETMPDNLRAAHDRNDETLERIYIGRRFRNDTERLEKLFEMYTKMTSKKVGDARA